MSSAAEFVEGGVQDPCDDACSICLEEFCDQDPASITGCNHAYHLQCILEWAQRSSECPMCWQLLVMKDPVGQELLASAQQERSLRANQIHTSSLQLRSEDHELDQFASFEERLMRHLAAASARQAHGQWRRNRFHFRPVSNEYPGQFIYLPNSASPASTVFETLGETHSLPEERPAVERNHPRFVVGDTRPFHCNATHRPAPSATSIPGVGTSTSEFHSFSEALKSRWTAASSKYKDTFTKTARLFRDKMRARNAPRSDAVVRPQDLRTSVAQALGQISVESAGESRVQEKAPTYVSLKQAYILEQKQSETLSPSFTHNMSDAGKSNFQDISRNASVPASFDTAGSSEGIDLKLTSLRGDEPVVEDKQAISSV